MVEKVLVEEHGGAQLVSHPGNGEPPVIRSFESDDALLRTQRWENVKRFLPQVLASRLDPLFNEEIAEGDFTHAA